MARRLTARTCAALWLGASLGPGAASAQQEYIPGIWVDPDGCEHWVMDDGAEGYMSPHRRRDGTPVCRRAAICGTVAADQLFAGGQAAIDASTRARLTEFFRGATATGFLIYGHTDDQGGDAANLGLSMRRARAVADVAAASGVPVIDIQGFGERRPVASNATAAGSRANRRVEIYCLR